MGTRIITTSGKRQSKLLQLTDIVIDTPVDQGALIWDAASATWTQAGAGGGGGGGSAPSGGLIAQFRASDIAAGNGTSISSWSDAGATLTLTAGAGEEPTFYDSGGPNSLEYVDFAAAHRMVGSTEFLVGYPDLDVYMAFQVPTLVSYYFACFGGSGAGLPSLGDYDNWGAYEGVYLVNGPHLGNPNISIRSWLVGRFRWDGANSIVRLAANEVTGDTGTITPGTLAVGGHRNNSYPGEWAELEVAEVLLYDGSQEGSAYNATDVLSYLGTRLSLPVA